MRRYLPRPHQVVLLIGVLAALGTLASGLAPEITGWHDDSPIAREVFVNIPAAARGRLLPRGGHRAVPRRVARRRCGSATTSGASPTTAAPTRATSTAACATSARGVWMRTLLRDPAAGVMHSIIYFGFLVLFIVTVRARDRPPAARLAEVPARPHLPGVRVHRRPLRPRLPRRASLWAFVRRYGAAALPDPHQDQARAPRDPRDVPRHRRHRLHHRGVPHRGAARSRRRRRANFEKWSLRRLGALVDLSTAGTLADAARPAPLVVDRST